MSCGNTLPKPAGVSSPSRASTRPRFATAGSGDHLPDWNAFFGCSASFSAHAGSASTYALLLVQRPLEFSYQIATSADGPPMRIAARSFTLMLTTRDFG